jgi:anaerobic sulfite reductase subunit B
MTYLPKEYELTNVKKYTNDVKLFKVKCNKNPEPGQFIEVSIPGIGECPLASCSYNPEYVELLTRNAGNVTSAMFNSLSKSSLFIRGPYGKGFPVEELKNKNLILIAGGTGIAPITSLINYIEKNRKDFKKIIIYFGFRDEKNILLKDKISKWNKKFKVHICLSDDPNNKNYESGFINELMKKHKPETKNSVFLLCGPEIMMDVATKHLNKCKITNNRIYWSLERRMECGFGSCGRCQLQDMYVCKDGPIFRYDKIKSRLDNENSAHKK